MENAIGDRLKHYGLDGANISDIKRIGKMVVPHLDAVLNNFYDKAMDIPEAAEMFRDPAILKHARGAQKKHWERMFQGDFGDAYLQSCERVGRTHFRIQLPFQLYFSAYSHATSDVQAALLKSFGRVASARNPKELARLLGVLNRCFAMDSALVIEAYFQAQSKELSYTFSTIDQALARLADGDLSYRIDQHTAPEFSARYDDVRSAWNQGLTHLCDTMGTVNSTIDFVATSSTKIEKSTEALSTQAASMKETAAAMDRLAESVKSTATNTKEADTVARNARKEAENGALVVDNAAGAMKRIREASDEITNIISMIDDISFQTNLLALNAGVEAARAGEAGRGFAVVASEVRNLANSSTNAAQRIKELIQRSSEEVAEGVTLVDSAGNILKDVVSRFDSVVTIAAKVAGEADDQAVSLGEVTSAVNNMERVTQQNTARAQESSDEVHLLVNKINELTQQLSRFQTGSTTRSPLLNTLAA